MHRYVLNGSSRVKAALFGITNSLVGQRPGLLVKLGSAYATFSAWPAAVSAYEAALARDDTTAEWHYKLGVALEKTDRWHDASTAYCAALERDDKDPTWHCRSGAAFAKLENWPEAAKAFEEAIARNDKIAEWHLSLGAAYSGMDNWQGVVAAYEAAIVRKPNIAAWHARLGSARAKLEDWSGAANAFEAAVFRNPADASLHTRLASARMKLGDTAGAVEACNRAIACDVANVELHRRLSRILTRAQDWEGASASYSAAIKVDPENYLARYRLACCLSRSGSRGEALEAIQPCIDRSNHFLDEFLSDQSQRNGSCSTSKSKVLFAFGTNTVLTRKITITSASNTEQTFFEHMRVRRKQCERIVEFYECLEKSDCEKLSRYVPKLHHHSLGKRFSYFVYEHVEPAATMDRERIQTAALTNPTLARHLIDCLAEIARSDIRIDENVLHGDRYPASKIGAMQKYIRRQSRLNSRDREFVSALETVAENWPDHHSRYEQFPRVISHDNFHDRNVALTREGEIRIFDWELFGRASIATDLVTMFRRTGSTTDLRPWWITTLTRSV